MKRRGLFASFFDRPVVGFSCAGARARGVSDPMIVRLRSRDGLERVKVSEDATLAGNRYWVPKGEGIAELFAFFALVRIGTLAGQPPPMDAKAMTRNNHRVVLVFNWKRSCVMLRWI